MIVWAVAGLLALATGMRIGWGLVNRQSVVSSAMIVALGSLAVLAALNWPPLTRLVDSMSGRPGASVGLSQLALIASAAGSCVMITSVATTRPAGQTRRIAALQYGVAAGVGAFVAIRGQAAWGAWDAWLIPLLYVLLVMTLVSWVGMRLSNPTRRGRALFVFSAGTALIVATAAYLLFRGVTGEKRIGPLAGVGTGAVLLLCAMTMVAAGALMPSVEDWAGARREMRLIGPLEDELERRHPDIGIGIRPRGPLVFRVAERLSLISDAIYLEATLAGPDGSAEVGEPDRVTPVEQARAVARWLAAGSDKSGAFPGRDWLRQPRSYSDRDWILQIARQYRDLTTGRTAG